MSNEFLRQVVENIGPDESVTIRKDDDGCIFVTLSENLGEGIELSCSRVTGAVVLEAAEFNVLLSAVNSARDGLRKPGGKASVRAGDTISRQGR